MREEIDRGRKGKADVLEQKRFREQVEEGTERIESLVEVRLQLVGRALREDEEADRVGEGETDEGNQEDLLDRASAECAEMVGAFFGNDAAADEGDEGAGGGDGRLLQKQVSLEKCGGEESETKGGRRKRKESGPCSSRP